MSEASKAGSLNAFELVKELGCRLPNVQAATKYDGSPVLKVQGVFMAGLAMHPSAEPETLLVRATIDDAKAFWKKHPTPTILRITIDAIR